MPLDPRVLNSVVRITSAGDLLGTGFIVGVPSEAEPTRLWPYVVTAHHVIRNQVEVEIEVPDPLTRGELFEAVAVMDWRHPFPKIDLALAPFPFEAPELPRYQAFPLSHFVEHGTVVPLGGPIFYLGVFAPLNVPMGRAATLGALDVPIEKDDYSYTADLVDCRSYRGFSGSPCVSTMTYVMWDSEATGLPPGSVPPRADGSPQRLGTTASIARFCGMFTAHYSDEASAGGVVSRYGVGVMLHSDYIRLAVTTPELIEERRKGDEMAEAKKAAEMPPLEQAGGAAAAEDDEWDRFEDFTRRLVNGEQLSKGLTCPKTSD